MSMQTGPPPYDGLPDWDTEPTTNAPGPSWGWVPQAIIGFAIAILAGSAGIVYGQAQAQDVHVDGHKGEVLVDSDGDGDFEWIPEAQLHEMRGHDH